MTLAPAGAFADALVPGNLLVSTDNVVYETTPDGQNVQTFPTQYPGGYPSTEYARDIAVDDDGIVHVYNGTFSPYMSSYDPAAAIPTWTHQMHSNWNTANNLSYGGIDVDLSQVFVTDGLSDGNGVVVFNTDGGVAFRFADGTDAIDLTIGLDGLLYVLSPGGSPGGRTVDVYDPRTYSFIRSIDLTAIFGWTEHRSIAVDFNGDLFIADLDGEISHVSAAGQLVQIISPPCDWIGFEIACSFTDIDISESGQLALGSRFGEIVVTDVNFSSVSKFQIGDRSAFVEFVPQPPGPTKVEMDIRPGRYPNKVNLRRMKNVWIAILTSESFDATTVDPASVRLGPADAGINRNPRVVDVDGDGDNDLKLRFKVSEIGISCGDTELSLSASTFDGTEIVATDSIVTTGCN
jgi:hypothetical protein